MSRKLTSFLLAATAAAATAAAPAQAGPRLAPEQQLERALEGRVAGEPVDCLNMSRVRNSRVIENTALVFEAGDTLYVNRPRAGASALDRWNVQLTRLHLNQLCSIDTVEMIDPDSRMLAGVVFLGEFVPYRRVRD